MIWRHLLFGVAVFTMFLSAFRYAETGLLFYAIGTLLNAAWAGAEQWAIRNKIPFPDDGGRHDE